MFWIGLIVGIIITVILSFVFLAVCCNIADITVKDIDAGSNILRAAWENRESTVTVIHDDEIIDSVTFEEH